MDWHYVFASSSLFVDDTNDNIMVNYLLFFTLLCVFNGLLCVFRFPNFRGLCGRCEVKGV